MHTGGDSVREAVRRADGEHPFAGPQTHRVAQLQHCQALHCPTQSQHQSVIGRVHNSEHGSTNARDWLSSRLVSNAYSGRMLEFDGGKVGVRVDGVHARRVHAAVRRANVQVALAGAGHHVRVREHEAVLAHDEAAPVVPHAEVADHRVPAERILTQFSSRQRNKTTTRLYVYICITWWCRFR